MHYQITHDIPGRMRVRTGKYSFHVRQSASLEEAISHLSGVLSVEANHRTNGILIFYQNGFRRQILTFLSHLQINSLPESQGGIESKQIEDEFFANVVNLCMRRYIIRPLLPPPVRKVITLLSSMGFFQNGLMHLVHGSITTPVLDASAIGAALIQKEIETAGSIMFFLHLSEYLEEYTKKKTTTALAKSLAIHVDMVWKIEDGEEKAVPLAEISLGDLIVIRTGSVIPVDGFISSGEAMINESCMTGEPLSIRKAMGSSVYAGTVLEEGSIAIEVKALNNETRMSRIIQMIEDSEALKADVQSKAEKLADSIVPYSFLGAFGVYLLTRNMTKALSVLMVDYSCSLKLSTPICIISAMAEASQHKIMVKGGKFLEEFALADTIVFDKTGTLTTANPVVTKVVSLNGFTREEVLKYSACLEEHFPHSVARAVVRKAEEEDLKHREEHADVRYVVAHGIATTLHGKPACIGSAHFIFEDEKIPLCEEHKKVIEEETNGSSVIYLSIGGELAGFLCITDSTRPEARAVIQGFRDLGIHHIVMLTGDGESAAKNVCRELGMYECHSQKLPEEKAAIIESLKAEGRRVIMVGDGINDSPALATAHVSVSMKDASDIAVEVADITLLSADLRDLLLLRELSMRLLRRVDRNYRFIIGFNTSLLALGQFEILAPTTTAVLHNASTMGVSVGSMQPLLPEVV